VKCILEEKIYQPIDILVEQWFPTSKTNESTLESAHLLKDVQRGHLDPFLNPRIGGVTPLTLKIAAAGPHKDSRHSD
jgi:hypothetical protein